MSLIAQLFWSKMASFTTNEEALKPVISNDSSSSSSVSSFALKLATAPTLGYKTALISVVHDQYHPESNPNGIIIMAVAENKLCREMLLIRIQDAVQTLQAVPDVMNYTSTFGLPWVRDNIGKFLSEYLFCGLSVNSDNLVLSAGCVATLVQLSLLLFEPGDAILVPTPYYPAFDHDFDDFGSVCTWPVHVGSGTGTAGFDAAVGTLTDEKLDAAFDAALAAGHRPRGILLTNPGNPTGVVMDHVEYRNVLHWVRRRNANAGKTVIHLIADEVYALSLFPGRSPWSIVRDCENGVLGEDVHVMWGISKDMGMSGMRLAVLYTQNSLLLKAFSSSNDAFMTSNLIQRVTSEILSDRAFMTTYLFENSQRLYTSYCILKQAFEEINIPVLPADGGIFAFCDFRFYLNDQTYEAEQELFQRLFAVGVLLTPGEACHCSAPGFFRACYAFVQPSGLEEGIRRIKKLLGQL